MHESADKKQDSIGGVRFLVLNAIAVLATAVLALALLLSTQAISAESDALQQANDRYATCEMAVNDLLEASTYLTTQSRLFDTTHHTAYLDNYFWELSKTQRRENDAATVIESYPDSDAAKYAESALEFSDKLSGNELYAMKLVVEGLDLNIDEDIAAALDAIGFQRGDEFLSSAELLDKAHMLVTYEPYEHDVDRVAQQIERCKDALAKTLEADKTKHADALNSLFLLQQVLTVTLLIVVLIAAIVFVFIITRPINEFIARITRGEHLEEKGAYELKFLARAYNTMHDDNQKARDRLTYEAEHDSLTGLLNRGAFNRAINECRKFPMALAILDIDHFKEVNDRYGHDIGDLVLQRTAAQLGAAFKPEGTPYRLGGDEFVIILLGQADDLHEIIEQDAREVAAELSKAQGEVPAVNISAGVSFGDGTQTPGVLYKNADQALYRVKGEGRQGIAFGDEESIRPF